MKLRHALALIILLGSVITAQSTVHIITFKPNVYTPNDLTVAVGDTIEWQGDFEMHPLRSETYPLFPLAAAPISVDTGSVFQYVVTVPGNHEYYCLYHIGPGMIGVFRAIEFGVEEMEIAMALSAFPNPTAGTLQLSFTLEKATDVRVVIFDMSGKELMHTAGDFYAAGPNSVRLDVASLPVGSYCYCIETSDAVLTRTFVISR